MVQFLKNIYKCLTAFGKFSMGWKTILKKIQIDFFFLNQDWKNILKYLKCFYDTLFFYKKLIKLHT